jgi:hypothetical protein
VLPPLPPLSPLLLLRLRLLLLLAQLLDPWRRRWRFSIGDVDGFGY